MKLGPIKKFLEKDEEILWRLEDTFTRDRKKSIIAFFLFYFLIVIEFYLFFYIQFIKFENITFQEILFRNLYFLIFIVLFSILAYLIRKKFPLYINSEYFLTNLRLISLSYLGAKFGGYRTNSFYYPDITSVEILNSIKEDIFEVKISKNVKKGLLVKRNEIHEDECILDKKGLEILNQKIKKNF